jgi:formyl-CoA transferase
LRPCRRTRPIIAAWTRLAGRRAEARLEAADVPCSRLYDIADCAADPHFRARGSVMEVADPLIGPTLHFGPAIRLDSAKPQDGRLARPYHWRSYRLRSEYATH